MAYIEATGFGVVADDSTDNAEALQDAIDSAAGSVSGANGSCVILPKGTVRVGSQIVLKNKVRLVGMNKRSSIVKAASGFPTSTPVVRVGDGSSIVFDSRLEDLTIDCNDIAGSTAVYSTEAQEGSGVKNVLLTKYRSFGADFADGTSLVDVRHVEAFPSTSGSSAGVRLSGTAGVSTVHDLTVNGSAGGSHADGLLVVSAGAVLSMIHVEAHTDGIECGLNSSGAIIGATGHSSVANLVHLLDTTKDWTVQAVARNGATNALVDDWTGITWTDDYVRLYSSHEAIIGPCRIRAAGGSPEGAVTARVGSLFLRTNGGAGSTLYVKESGTGNTGWAAK